MNPQTSWLIWYLLTFLVLAFFSTPVSSALSVLFLEVLFQPGPLEVEQVEMGQLDLFLSVQLL